MAETTKIIKLPSGASIVIRKMKLGDQSYLASTARSRKAQQENVLVEMVNRCTLLFDDPGPYPGTESGAKVNWDKMLDGDFLAAAIELRKFSYREGKDYNVDLTCPSMGCNHKFGWSVNLDEDLFIQELPKESAARMKEGLPFETVIDGRVVKFNLGHVKDKDTTETLNRKFPGRDLAVMFRTKIVSVEGVDPKDLMNWLDGEGKGQYEGLTADDAEEMRDAFAKVDCGVDTEVEATCPRMMCGNAFSFALPFGGMLTPGRVLARRKQIRRLGTESSEELPPEISDE